MRLARITALLGLAAASAAFRAGAYEVNVWPGPVLQMDETGNVQSWSALGPFLFSGQSPGPEAGRTAGFRPLYVVTSGGGCVKTDLLYPLFYYRQYSDGYKWSVFDLINGQGTDTDVARVGVPTDRHFDIWPIYFSHEAADPAQTYHALLPVYGTIKYRLGYDRIFWVPFPLYVETDKKGKAVTYIPLSDCPAGPGHGERVRTLAALRRDEWPGAGPPPVLRLAPLLGQHGRARPRRARGHRPWDPVRVPPLLHPGERPGSISENYLWPFFGYTEKTVALPLQRAALLLAVPRAGEGRRPARGPLGPLLHPFQHQGGGFDLGGLALLAQVNVGRRRHQAGEDAVLLLPLLVAWTRASSLGRPWRTPTSATSGRFSASGTTAPAAGRSNSPARSRSSSPGNLDMRVVWTPLFSIYRYDHRPTGETSAPRSSGARSPGGGTPATTWPSSTWAPSSECAGGPAGPSGAS